MKNKINIGIAWFNMNDWEEWKKISPEEIEDTYDEWLAQALVLKSELKKKGMKVEQVNINPADFLKWCRQNNKKPDSYSRSGYVAELSENRGIKIELSEEQINDIAEDLECGMRIFLNIETKEIKTILEWDELASDEFWETELMEIEKNPDKYIGFDKMDPNHSFQLMQEFIETVDKEELKKKLESGLRLSKPYRNFKDIIDDDNVYRQRWFDFKHARYIDFVKEQLEEYNKEPDRKF